MDGCGKTMMMARPEGLAERSKRSPAACLAVSTVVATYCAALVVVEKGQTILWGAWHSQL
jgi:hypothetical protein